MKVGIFGKEIKDNTVEYVKILFAVLKEHSIELAIEKNFHESMQKFNIVATGVEMFSENRDIAHDIDLMITMGGDGTILRALSYIRDKEIPIVGINTGRLGFMTTISKEDIKDKINLIIKGEYKVKSRQILELSTSDKVKDLEFNFAMNEISVNRKETTSMVTVKTYLDGEYLDAYWGDGVIISTPMGSTGYSLSCGGPIIMPETNNFVVTPIASHNLYSRPVVISDDTNIDLHITGRADNYLVSLDSRIITVPQGIKLNIKKSNYVVKMVSFEGQKILTTLREKMSWGGDYRNE